MTFVTSEFHRKYTKTGFKSMLIGDAMSVMVRLLGRHHHSPPGHGEFIGYMTHAENVQNAALAMFCQYGLCSLQYSRLYSLNRCGETASPYPIQYLMILQRYWELNLSEMPQQLTSRVSFFLYF